MDALDRDSLLRVLACCAVRDVLALACTCRQLCRDLRDDDLWRDLAVRKWGPAVQRLTCVPPGGWAAWTKHRLSAASQPLSPLDLIQVRSCVLACAGVARVLVLVCVCALVCAWV
jgi:hypothetical protein